MTWQAEALRWFSRHVMRPSLARERTPEAARAHFDLNARRLFRPPPLSLMQQGSVGGVPGLWVSNRPHVEGAILYFHGGAYILGSSRSHAPMLAEIARRTGLRAFLPDYRLAPEHPFPAAFDDALAAWQGLLAQGYAANRILLGGDSAGGGLALALLSQLCRAGTPPAGVFAFSPWTDLTFSGASLVTNASRDQLLPAHRLTAVRTEILGGARPGDADDPRLSPLHAAFPGAPPVMIHAAETEILRDDALRMRGRLPHAEIRIAGDLPHAWPILHNWLPEARATLDQTGRFILGCLPAASDES
ncbi:MAG: alpha/beta hydrolase [Rhodobacter sp.]|uniref:alpha/beta hydrolase fold domain-containing protein n=1 Tax=Pararhodobacter sp. TaxID=2127056 RepID=UPI001DFA3D76|nr:alpha/beta hydrolase fold domain-containing protein [Pararhodobacter sp.]MCB1345842.1 alpha/beta hydrolase [Paracoccaceae bacterium]MCB1388790.1 alpha/beta hydrolase [Paracoccaceae bacterium]MCC0072008.1 alpha/beta hydrolase [Rhodobacter sp.]HPD93610.1 alpha/beta hydrolase fold domain-containing protein [Pararhodobacter sp.]